MRASTFCALRCGIAGPLITLLGNSQVDASNVMHALFLLCSDSLCIESWRAESSRAESWGAESWGAESWGAEAGIEIGGNVLGANGLSGNGGGGAGLGAGNVTSYTWTTETCSALVRAASRILAIGDTGDASTCNRAMRVVAAAARLDSVVCDLVVELGTVAHALCILKATAGAPRRNFTSLYAIELLFVTGWGYEGEHTAHINRQCIEAGAVRDVVATVRAWHVGGNSAAYSPDTETLVALGLKHLSNAVESGGELARAFLDAGGVAAIIEFLSGDYSCPSSAERTTALQLLSVCADVKENLRASALEEKIAAAESRASAAESRASAAESSASAAESRASAAESRASAAESRASAAESSASAAESRASAAESRASAAESRASAAESRASAAESRASAAESRAADATAVLNEVHTIVGPYAARTAGV